MLPNTITSDTYLNLLMLKNQRNFFSSIPSILPMGGNIRHKLQTELPERTLDERRWSGQSSSCFRCGKEFPSRKADTNHFVSAPSGRSSEPHLWAQMNEFLLIGWRGFFIEFSFNARLHTPLTPSLCFSKMLTWRHWGWDLQYGLETQSTHSYFEKQLTLQKRVRRGEKGQIPAGMGIENQRRW